jgi:hypothetical protein
MASRMAKLDEQLMIKMQKLKIQMFAKYKRTVSISDLVELLYDQDPQLIKLINTLKEDK